MRETRNAQCSIFEKYSEHEYGVQLKELSALLDEYPEILKLVDLDLRTKEARDCGAHGLSSESVFRCLLLKQIMQLSYERLAFHLSDSQTYRTFARLSHGCDPSRSGLQSTIRRISAETLEQINHLLVGSWIEDGSVSARKLRIDSTVVESDIAPPSDSALLYDGIRVLSRLLVTGHHKTGVKLRVVDQRKRSKSLSFRIFHAKKAEKAALYPQLLSCAKTVLKQIDRSLPLVEMSGNQDHQTRKWLEQVCHYRTLLSLVMEQTTRRVIEGETVPASEKIVSLFEEHTDIIVKGMRDVQYGHKVNLATDENGFIAYLSVEAGNPSDKDLYLPVLESLEEDYGVIPQSTVCDGGYASHKNVENARARGVRQAAFHKRFGLGCHEMGVKEKTLKKLRDFRAGIEGNISEFKRAFGAAKATWKGVEGFNAFVWASALSYNLVRHVRLNSG